MGSIGFPTNCRVVPSPHGFCRSSRTFKPQPSVLAHQGKGVDRHLFALKCMAKRQADERSKDGAPPPPLPAIFADRAWEVLSYVILSTRFDICSTPSLSTSILRVLPNSIVHGRERQNSGSAIVALVSSGEWLQILFASPVVPT